MATKIVMEALSPTMEEGRLVEWKKAEGDTVTHGDVLAEVETDKAVMELVSRTEGTLLRQLVKAGATVPVSEIVGWIGAPDEEIPEAGGGTEKGQEKPSRERGSKDEKSTDGRPAGQAAKEADEAEPAEGEPAEAEPVEAKRAEAKPAATAAPARAEGRVKASPLARRIARERGLDLSAIEGSGPEGRIIQRDVEDAEAPVAAGTPAPSTRPATEGGYEDVPLSQVRKTIAKRLVQSLGPIPTFFLTAEVDMERTWDARAALNHAAGDDGKISFNDIIIRAVASALRRHPACNAWWRENAIRTWHEVHIGMAVAIPDGLITPVIRHADQKSLREISAEARHLASRARARKLTPEEYTGATFSISNLGMFAIEHFTAIINPPEAGIIAVGRIAEVPAVVDGVIVPRRRMRLTMSCDHRVIDGATGAEFLKTVSMFLENPLAMVW